MVIVQGKRGTNKLFVLFNYLEQSPQFIVVKVSKKLATEEIKIGFPKKSQDFCYLVYCQNFVSLCPRGYEQFRLN